MKRETIPGRKGRFAMSIDRMDPGYERLPAVCCHIPVVFGQAGIRGSVTQNIALLPGEGVDRPDFTLEKAGDFYIAGVQVRPHAKVSDCSRAVVVDVRVKVAYTLWYSDGESRRSQTDSATFELVVENAPLPPDRVKTFESGRHGGRDGVGRPSRYFRVDALAQSYGEIICPCTGALILDVGIFFILRWERRVPLIIPVPEGRPDVRPEISRFVPVRPSG